MTVTKKARGTLVTVRENVEIVMVMRTWVDVRKMQRFRGYTGIDPGAEQVLKVLLQREVTADASRVASLSLNPRQPAYPPHPRPEYRNRCR